MLVHPAGPLLSTGIPEEHPEAFFLLLISLRSSFAYSERKTGDRELQEKVALL